jgi:putative DNA primase/helicase
VTKCDAGGYAGMADSGDDDKSGYSDAFKRAAVKFGVARYLYRDGVPETYHLFFACGPRRLAPRPGFDRMDPTAAPDLPTIAFEAIPAELRALDRWVLWRRIERDGKPTKVPFDPATDRPGDATDPTLWLPFDRAVALAPRYDGIGLAIGGSGYVGVDLDHCLRDGELEPWALDVVERLASYTEITPSGEGLRVWVRGSLPPGRRRKGSIELYDSGRYFTVTGNRLDWAPAAIAERTAELAALHADLFPAAPERPRREPAPTDLADSELLSRMFRARNGAEVESLFRGDSSRHPSGSEADLALCSHLAFWTGGDTVAIDRLFRQSALCDDKWTERADYRERTIAKAMEGVDYYDPGRRRPNSGNSGDFGDRHTRTRDRACACAVDRQNSLNGQYSPPLLEGQLSEDWPEPVLDDSAPPAPFPLDVFPPPVIELVGCGSEGLCCPPDFLAATALGVASGAIGRSLAVRLKEGWVESPSLYLAIVADPGMTKSPAMALASRPAWAIARDLLGEHRLEAERHKVSGDKSPGPRPRRIVVEDSTVEALAGILRDNPRGLVMVRDELSALFAGHNQYKGGKGADRQFYLSAWSGSPVSVDRKGNPDGVPIHIPHPFLSIVGGLTPGMLSELAEAKGRDDGFLDRILFTQPGPVRVRWQDFGVPEAVTAEWDRIIRRLWGVPMIRDEGRDRPFLVRLAPDAEVLFAAWFDAHCAEAEADDFPPYLRGPWAKLRAYCGRLALVLDRLARACDPDPDRFDAGDVSAASMAAAIRLVGYFKAHTRRVRALIRGAFGENADARAILRWAARTGRPEFSERDARHNFPSRFPADGPELGLALRWLEGRHCIRPKAPPERRGAGRPSSPAYEVNPALIGPSEGARDDA